MHLADFSAFIAKALWGPVFADKNPIALLHKECIMPRQIPLGQLYAQEEAIERAVVDEQIFLAWLKRSPENLEHYVETLSEDRSVLFESWEVLP